MQVSVENKSSLERKLNIQIPASEVDSKVETRVRDLGKRVRIKGFRPGKVPYKVLQQRYGKDVRREVVGEVVQQSLMEAIDSQSLRPAIVPSIETLINKESQDLEYSATFEIFPELQAIDIDALEVKQLTAEIGEGDIDSMIETLQLQRRTWDEVERPAQNDDLVVVDYVCYANDNESNRFDEKAGTILGSGALAGDFETQLVGKKVNDEASFDIQFPDDYKIAELVGLEGKIEFKIVKVSEPKMPEIDSEFVSDFGVEDGSIESFRGDVKENLERELKRGLHLKMKITLLEALTELLPDVEIPESLVSQDAQSLHQQSLSQSTNAGDLSVESFVEPARKRVLAGLLLSEIARQNEIVVEPARVRQAITDVASTYEDPMQVVEYYQNDQGAMQHIHNQVLEEQVVDWVFENAKVTQVPSTFSDVLKQESI